MAWFDGQATNPAAGAVIADTGAIAGPTNVSFACAVHSSLIGTFELQQVDSGGTVLHRQKMSVLAAGESLTTSGIYTTVQNNDHLRIVCVSALLATVGASIWVA